MDPILTIEFDDGAVRKAFRALDAALARRALNACRVTAEAAAREARARLRRQLSSASTGTTAAGIRTVPTKDGTGYVLEVARQQYPNLPLWLEKGTDAGKRQNAARTAPRPFFYVALEMEANNHERRILDAMRDAGNDAGLGD